MTTLYINDSIRFIGSSETAERIQRTMTRAADEIRNMCEDIRQLHAMREQAERTNDPRDWALYSDFHKDVYGVRPHW